MKAMRSLKSLPDGADPLEPTACYEKSRRARIDPADRSRASSVS